MRILFVCHRLPYPPNRGGKIRSFNMIAHLAKKHSVVVASLAHTKEEMEEGRSLREHCDEVIAEVLPDRARWLSAVTAMPTRTPSSVAFFRSSRLSHRVIEASRRNSFDVVMVHCAFVAQYVESTSAALRILDYGDMDSAKWREYSQHRHLPLSWGYGLEARKLRDYERRVAATFNHCTVTTNGELEEFETLRTGVPCTVIPNGVDTSYFRHGGDSKPTDPVIAFVGRMDYFPNIDAACYFVEEVFPLIRQQIPTAQFRIVGSDPSRRVTELKRIPGVTVTGHVPDVRVFLKDSTVAVAPLRIARGTQNKILEAMAMGIPVVTTPQAAKGIEATPGLHMLVANDACEFAAKVVQALTNETLRASVAMAARKHLDSAHVWPGSMEILDELIEGSTQRRSRGSNHTNVVAAVPVS